jgi:Restriction alleviation protein Lar
MRIPKAKPCPFCKSTSGFVERMDLSSYQFVCNDCFAHGPNVCDSRWEDDKAEVEATRAWNKRRKAPTITSQQQNTTQEKT